MSGGETALPFLLKRKLLGEIKFEILQHDEHDMAFYQLRGSMKPVISKR
jgi:hypothetical protein